MPRLDHIVEHLYTNPGTELVLESNTTGVYRSGHSSDLPVFRQMLRTGQILLLFADVVPKEDSQVLLSGQPVHFRYAGPRGPLDVHMSMTGADIVVRVALPEVVAPRRGLAAVETPVPQAAPQVPAGDLARLIGELPARRATHLHLAPGQPPFLRVDGALLAAPEFGPVSAGQVREALATLAPPGLKELVATHGRFSFSHVTRDSVFHVRAQEARNGVSVVVRCVPRQVATPQTLGLPPGLAEGLAAPGLWVIAGAAGQGVSTSLASLTQAFLSTRPATVFSVESHIDYVLSDGLGLAQQVEVGAHVGSAVEALVDARAMDTDLVVVAELEDPEVLAEAVGLADRGRLVLGALHARGVVDAVGRMLTALTTPAAQARLAGVLKGVLGQQLLPGVEHQRVLAWELLTVKDAAAQAIRQNAPAELAPLRDVSFDMSLKALVFSGALQAEVALSASSDRPWLERELGRLAHTRAA